MVDANYFAVYDKDKVNFSNTKTTKMVILDEAVLTGWQDPLNGMWQVPLIDKPTNLNTNTLILDHPTKLKSLNSLYIVNTTMATQQPIQALIDYAQSSLSLAMEVINNVYELPSIEQSIWYLHAAAGHPELPTWLKAISRGNYNSWPLLTICNARKYFLNERSPSSKLQHT